MVQAADLPTEDPPGSSMYHITCALAELIDTAEADVAEGSRVVGR